MDALVDDGFVETLPEGLRAAHAVFRNYGFYISSSRSERLRLLEAATPVSAPAGEVLVESGYAGIDFPFERVPLETPARPQVYIVSAS